VRGFDGALALFQPVDAHVQVDQVRHHQEHRRHCQQPGPAHGRRRRLTDHDSVIKRQHFGFVFLRLHSAQGDVENLDFSLRLQAAINWQCRRRVALRSC